MPSAAGPGAAPQQSSTLITTLRIATRQSALALWQAEYVKTQLRQFYPQLNVSLVPLTSRGDQVLDIPLAKVGGKGLFVKELEQALLDNRADIAVHSMKDVPMEFPDGLGLAAICEREDPRDALVSNHFEQLRDLPQDSRVGTSSLRRQCQLLAARPDLQIAFLRGNVNTRLNKLDAGEFDAIILAAAGLIRLELGERIKQRLPAELSLPAAGQGAVGIECRSEDEAIMRLLQALHHPDTAQALSAERAVVRRLEGGCQVPIGAYATLSADAATLSLRALVGSPDGKTVVREQLTGPVEQAQALGTEVAERLLAAGAGPLLALSQ